MRTWEHIKLGKLPRHNGIGFFCWGISFKIHIRNKKGVVYIWGWDLSFVVGVEGKKEEGFSVGGGGGKELGLLNIGP